MTLTQYIVLVREDEDDGGNWWKKGQYDASTPADALRLAYADTYATPRRSGATTSRYRVAVVGPDIGWREYTVAVDAQPANVSVNAVTGPQPPTCACGAGCEDDACTEQAHATGSQRDA